MEGSNLLDKKELIKNYLLEDGLRMRSEGLDLKLPGMCTIILMRFAGNYKEDFLKD